MPITIRSSNGIIEFFTATQATPQVVDLSDAAIGDVRVLAINSSPDGTAGIGTITIPTGWTQISTNTNTGAASDSKLTVIYRVVQSGDTLTSATLSITTSTSMTIGTVAVTLEGVDTAVVEDVTAPAMTTGSHPISSPSITTVTNTAWVFSAGIQDGATGSIDDTDVPTGMTVIGTMANNPPSNGMNLGLAYVEQATAGASGTKTWQTNTGSEETVGCTFALRPLTSGITNVVPSEFSMNEVIVTIFGGGFGGTQGATDVYLSPNDLLSEAGEVDITAAVEDWDDAQIDLNLTLLNQTVLDDLQTMGPGARFMIVNVGGVPGTTEYFFPITLHRPHELSMSASAFIAAGGENTTARLTAPSGKTTGDFGGGRIQDDENPGDAVDLLINEYREDEWSIESIAGTEGLAFDLRVVTGDDTLLDTYTVNPVLTIASGFTGTVAMTSPFVDVTTSGDLAFSGTVDITSPFVDITASAVEIFSGSIATTSPFITISVTAEQIFSTTIDVTSPFVEIDATGLETFIAAADITSPFVDITAVGEQTISGSVDAIAPFVGISSDGLLEFLGQADVISPFVELSATGEIVGLQFTGVVDMTAPFVDQSAIGEVPLIGVASVTSPFVDLSATALLGFSGTGATTSPFVNSAIIAELQFVASVDFKAPFVEQALAGTLIYEATLSVTAPFIDIESSGILAFSGDAAVISPFVDPTILGAVANNVGSLDVTSPFVEITASAEVQFISTLAVESPFIEMASAGQVITPVTGVAAMDAPFVGMMSSGQLQLIAALDVTSPFVAQAATAEEIFVSIAALVSPYVELEAFGTSVFIGTSSVIAPFVEIDAIGGRDIDVGGPIDMASPFVQITMKGLVPPTVVEPIVIAVDDADAIEVIVDDVIRVET